MCVETLRPPLRWRLPLAGFCVMFIVIFGILAYIEVRDSGWGSAATPLVCAIVGLVLCGRVLTARVVLRQNVLKVAGHFWTRTIQREAIVSTAIDVQMGMMLPRSMLVVYVEGCDRPISTPIESLMGVSQAVRLAHERTERWLG